MVNLGESVTLKRKSTGETKTGKVIRVEAKVQLDEPIIINTPWYQDTVSEVTVPSDNYELVTKGGKRKSKKTRRSRRGHKGTRRR